MSSEINDVAHEESKINENKNISGDSDDIKVDIHLYVMFKLTEIQPDPRSVLQINLFSFIPHQIIYRIYSHFLIRSKCSKKYCSYLT